jgi:hypothetical protein
MQYSHACTAHRPIGKKPDQEVLANGASPRLHLEHLSVSAPELNPGESLWPQLIWLAYKYSALMASTK